MTYRFRQQKPFESYSAFENVGEFLTAELAGEWQGEISKNPNRYVQWLQQSLNKVVKLRVPLVEDGDFGKNTRNALWIFRNKERLKHSGDIICPETEKKLIAAGANPPPGLATARAAETTPPGLTIYVDIPLQVRLGSAKSMTGIFVPENYCARPQVDLIVYLHGFKVRSHDPTFSIDSYWSLPKFRLREEVNKSKRNVILVAPTLGPQSQAGSLVCSGGFDRFLDQVMIALKQFGPYSKAQKAPSIGNIILAGHSGGGSVMRAIAMGGDTSATRIQECWAYEPSFMGSGQAWKNWARLRPSAKLYIYYIGGRAGETLCQSIKGGRLTAGARINCASNVFGEKTTAGHDDVPSAHLMSSIQGTNVLVAKSNCPTKPTGEIPEGGFENAESEVYETIPLIKEASEFETATPAVPKPKTISIYNTDLSAPYFGGNFNFLYNGGSNEAWITYNTYFSYLRSFPERDKALLLENLKKAIAIWDGCAEVQVKDVAGSYNDRIRLRFKLNIVTNSRNANKRTQVHPAGSRTVFFIDKDRETVMRDLNIFIGSSRDVLVHELGHVWGLMDEYKDRWISMKLSLGHVGPDSPLINDTSSIMNTGYDRNGEFRTRYFAHFGRAILGAFWGLKKYMVPARINGRVVSNTVMGRIALRKRDIAGNAPYTADQPPFNTVFTHIQIAKRA
jgi:hypothetical protein